MHGKLGVEFIFRPLREAGAGRNPSVVDQEVETIDAHRAERVVDTRNKAIERTGYACVEFKRDAGRTRLGREGDNRVGFCPVRLEGEDRAYASLCQSQHGIATNTSTSAGDNRYLAGSVLCGV